MATDPADLTPAALDFMSERHLATFTTLRATGRRTSCRSGSPGMPTRSSPGSSPAGAARRWPRRAGRRAALSQVDGRRWITLEGTTRVLEDAASVRDAGAAVCRALPRAAPQPQRVVVVLDVDRVLGGSWPDPLPPSPYPT